MSGEVTLEGMDATAMAELASLSQRLATNPKTREGFLRLTKVDNPSLNIPEIDLKNQVGTVLAAQHKKITELEGKLISRQKQDDAVAAESKALRSNGIGEDRKEEIRKFMLDNKVADFESGAKLFKMSQEAAVPSAGPGKVYGIQMPTDFKTISANPSTWANNEAAKAMDDIIKARRQAA